MAEPGTDIVERLRLEARTAVSDWAHSFVPLFEEAADTITRLRSQLEAHKQCKEALELLVHDVQDYEAWERPCHALDEAKSALSRLKQMEGEG